MTRLTVMAAPAFRNKGSNPYNYLLYSNLEKIDVRVFEWSRKDLCLKNIQIVHLHWPDFLINQKHFLPSLLRLIDLIFLISIAKIRNIKIIWTAHNSKPHELNQPLLTKTFWAFFIRSLDGWLSLSKTSTEELIRDRPLLASKPHAVTPHGHYKNIFSSVPLKSKSRSELKVPAGAFVLLFFGQIRRYKNVSALIGAFKKMASRNSALLIVGECSDEMLKTEITGESKADSRIHLHLKSPTDADLPTYFSAADVCILPYQKILNSGAAYLSLSLNVPLATSAQGSLLDLHQEVGSQWVKLLHGPLNEQALSDIEEWSYKARPVSPNLESFDWSRIAQMTLAFYARVVGKSNF